MGISNHGEIARRRKLLLSIAVLIAALGCAYIFLNQLNALSLGQGFAQQEKRSPSRPNSKKERQSESQLRVPSQKNVQTALRSDFENVVPPTGDTRQVIAQLRPRAEAGDGRAALMIHLKLYQCANEMSLNAMEDMAERLEKAGVSGGEFIANQQQIRQECESSAGMLAEQGKWLELAADSGDVVAQLLYASNSRALFPNASDMLADPSGVARYKEKANRFMSELVSRGSTQAMMWYAGAYDSGVMVPKNPVRSYAYYRLVEISAPGTISKELMDDQVRKVPSQKIAEADALARAWYLNCCKK